MFIKNKYFKWYYEIVTKAKTRDIEGYVEHHHIIPKSLGGTNNKDNLVKLSAKEHFVAHLLLTKMTEGEDKKKMVRAFWLMSKGTGKRYAPCSKMYEIARALFVTAQKGHPNYLKSQSDKSKQKISIGMSNILSNLSDEELAARTKNSWSSPKSWTIERKEKISKALTGKIVSDETRKKMSTKCIFISQNGEKYFYDSIKEGCKNHSFNYGSVKNNISNGKPYKGWKIIYDSET